jgi:hypothetical protein
MAGDEKQFLDYATSPKQSQLAKAVLRISFWVAAAFVLFVAAFALPHPEGIWYFGSRPQWLLAIDHSGLAFGPTGRSVLLGWIPLIVAKLLVYGLPVWLLGRCWLGPRRKRSDDISK